MKLFSLSVAAILALSFQSASAETQTIAYPSTEAASFVIVAPEDWELEPAEEEGQFFDLTGPTGAVFSFRTIEGSEDALKEAIDESFVEIAERFDNVEMGEAQAWTPNGLEGFYATGTGKDKEDGTARRIGVGWAILKDNRLAEFWFVGEATDQEGLSAAEAIANSMQAP
ncbi:MAG: hypothetical protein SFU53_10255 [Terrimicrobiaceae bacterium]|nr:hypothetical protein [Terrimicrobiaceae bacterium]